MSTLTCKFWILVTAQVGSLKSRLFIEMQCVVIDYFLRVFISTSDWLWACAAIERAVNVTKGSRFDKVKSKKLAKWIVIIVSLLTICTYLHDPISRKLIDDEEEQRTWCIITYSPFLQLYDHILNVLHFSLPVLINCISALIVIIIAARSRSNVQKNLTYKRILHEQFQHHKHLLISPFFLVLFTLPRLVFSFLFGCMKSARNPLFYLIGYCISFVPSMVTFVIFVLPSKTYKKEFKDSLRCFHRQ